MVENTAGQLVESKPAGRTISLNIRGWKDFQTLRDLDVGNLSGHPLADALTQARKTLSVLGLKPFFEISEEGLMASKTGYAYQAKEILGVTTDGEHGVIGAKIIVKEVFASDVAHTSPELRSIVSASGGEVNF